MICLAIYLGGDSLLLPKSQDDDGPTIIFASVGHWIGDIEITKRVRPNRTLTDVWGRPLRLILKRWWRNSEKKLTDNSRLARRAAIAFPVTPGASAAKELVICRRRGGSESL